MHLRRPLEKKARTRTGRRADTGEDSSREAMTQTGLEDLLEEALRFFSNYLCPVVLKGGLVPKMDWSLYRNLLGNKFGATAGATRRATPKDSGARNVLPWVEDERFGMI